MKHWTNIVVCICIFLATACTKTPPQRPTVKGQEKDETKDRLLAMNQQMAKQADWQLAGMVSDAYTLLEDCIWVKDYVEVSKSQRIKEGENISIAAYIYDLQGNQLLSHQLEAKVGQIDAIPAIVQIITCMRRGMHVSMLVPWYMGFGSAGTTEVPPYENIRVELDIN